MTGRPESWRSLTEDWLGRNGIAYGELIMWDRPAMPRHCAIDTDFKAEVYRDCAATLFVEDNARLAKTIAERAGKPVLCLAANRVVHPKALSPVALRQRVVALPGQLKQQGLQSAAPVKALARSLIGPSHWETLKAALRVPRGQP